MAKAFGSTPGRDGEDENGGRSARPEHSDTEVHGGCRCTESVRDRDPFSNHDSLDAPNYVPHAAALSFYGQSPRMRCASATRPTARLHADNRISTFRSLASA